MTILKRAGSVMVTGVALAGVLALSVGSAGATTNARTAATWTVSRAAPSRPRRG